MATAPITIVAGPFEFWVAPVGETMPLIDAAPAGNWVKVGTSGDRSMAEDGVTISHGSTETPYRVLGDTLPIKFFRSEENITLSMVLADMSLANYAYALNYNPVTDNAPGSGVAGYKEINLRKGFDVTPKALLIRGTGASPEQSGKNVQYEIPSAVQTGQPSAVFTKASPMSLALEWTVTIDPSASTAAARAGRLIAQDQDAT